MGGDLCQKCRTVVVEDRAVTWVVAHTDGGSRGNPGPAGIGVVLEHEDGRLIEERAEYCGRKTCNVAEYLALQAAIRMALSCGFTRLKVYSDSRLMVSQVRGEWKVKDPTLQKLCEAVQRAAMEFEGFQIIHVPRERNKRADQLANIAMDQALAQAMVDEEIIAKPRKK